MGEEAYPKGKKSAADLPMWDKETLPPKGFKYPLSHIQKKVCATDLPWWRSFLPQFENNCQQMSIIVFDNRQLSLKNPTKVKSNVSI